MQTLNILECAVRTDGDMVSLTDIWQIAESHGYAENKDEPKFWGRAPYTRKSKGKDVINQGKGWEFIESLAESLKVSATHLYQTKRGRHGGGTWTHWQIGLAYAQYLNPELHRQVNEIYARYKTGDPSLAVEVIDKQTDAKTAEWIASRAIGKATRLEFTGCLRDHAVRGNGYARCTNAIYQPLLGGTAKELKIQKGLSANTNLRDNIDTDELVAVMFSEVVAKRRITTKDAQGNKECTEECHQAGTAVAALM